LDESRLVPEPMMQLTGWEPDSFKATYVGHDAHRVGDDEQDGVRRVLRQRGHDLSEHKRRLPT
jgi:hypothetical protein